MPLRYPVPTLKLLCIRVVARPDGVSRSSQEGFPNSASKRREKNINAVFNRRGSKEVHYFLCYNPTSQQLLQDRARVNMGRYKDPDKVDMNLLHSYPLGPLSQRADEPEGFQYSQSYYSTDNEYPWGDEGQNHSQGQGQSQNQSHSEGQMLGNGAGEYRHRRKQRHNIVELILQAHIRLSTFYGCRLEEMKILRRFLQHSPQSIKSIDFLFEGLWLRDGTNLNKYVGVIPFSLSPQKIDPFTFQEICTLLRSTGVEEYLENLSLFFGSTSLITKSMADVSVYKFEQTLSGFKNMMKLVVHGDASDQFMEVVGKTCRFLEYLDVRDTLITENGILLLLFREPGYARTLTNSEVQYNLPKNILNPCCHTLRYLDISTIPYKGHLMQRNRAVTAVCDHLVQTPRRFFFYPLGTTRMFCQMDFFMEDFRNKVMSNVRTEFFDLLFELCKSLYRWLHQGYTHVESRVTPEGQEISFNFYNVLPKQLEIMKIQIVTDYLVLHMRLENLTVVDFTCYSASSCDFFPIDVLCRLLPNLEHLKASLDGVLANSEPGPSLETSQPAGQEQGKGQSPSPSENQGQSPGQNALPMLTRGGGNINIPCSREKQEFQKLKTLTIPIVYSKNTLVSIMRGSPALKYVEVRELYKGTTSITDGDVHDMVCQKSSVNLEILRFTFPTNITLFGVKALTLNCPQLRTVGDLKHWKISLPVLLKLKVSMIHHNFDFSFEFNNIIYPVRRTSCKEFY